MSCIGAYIYQWHYAHSMQQHVRVFSRTWRQCWENKQLWCLWCVLAWLHSTVTVFLVIYRAELFNNSLSAYHILWGCCQNMEKNVQLINWEFIQIKMKDKARFTHTDFMVHTCLTGHKIHAEHVSSMKLHKAYYETCYTTILATFAI